MNKVGRTLTAAAAVTTPIVGSFALTAPAASASVYRAVPAVATPNGSLELWYDDVTHEAWGKLVNPGGPCNDPSSNYFVQVANNAQQSASCYNGRTGHDTGRIPDRGLISSAFVTEYGTTYKTKWY